MTGAGRASRTCYYDKSSCCQIDSHSCATASGDDAVSRNSFVV